MKSEIKARPDFPEYYSKKARFESFEDWPKTMKQTSKELSDAGFFYTQKGDRVICYWCGIGLRQWEEYDDVWEQHALHQGDCEYLRMYKGAEYVTSVKVKFSVDEPDVSKLALTD